MINCIKISEDIVNEVQLADTTANVLRLVINDFIETHSKDLKGDALQSPAYLELEKRAAKAAISFNQKKDEMLQTLFGEKCERIRDWHLNYNNCTLTYEIIE